MGSQDIGIMGSQDGFGCSARSIPKMHPDLLGDLPEPGQVIPGDLLVDVQPFREKYFPSRFARHSITDSASRPNEGRWPSSRTLGGMRWTFLCLKTNGARADGEAVWS